MWKTTLQTAPLKKEKEEVLKALEQRFPCQPVLERMTEKDAMAGNRTMWEEWLEEELLWADYSLPCTALVAKDNTGKKEF